MVCFCILSTIEPDMLLSLCFAGIRVPAHLKKKAWAKYGTNHPDKDLIQPFPVPVVVFGTKYDIFQVQST